MKNFRKKILFVGIDFYDYEDAIIKEMKKQGFQVDYFKIGSKNLRFRISKHTGIGEENALKKINNSIIKKINNQYDYVFIIKAELCTTDFLEELKNRLNSIFIMYQWDSIKRVRNFEFTKKYFDYIFSFDRMDCLNHNFLFRPLFFRQEFCPKDKMNEGLFDVYSVAQFYEYRYSMIKRFSETHSKKINFLKLKIGRLNYFNNIFLRKMYDKHFFILKNIPIEKNIEYMSKSKTILDISDPNQSGLTMRSVESVGMKKKLITTNKDIVNYDFYNKNNIKIIDENNIEIDDSFFETPYQDIDDNIYKKYSLESWITDIFK